MPSVTFEQFGIFFACGIVLLFAIGSALKLFRREPPLYREYASKSELEALARRVDLLGEEIRDGFKELDRKRSVSIAGLHDDLERQTAEMRKEVKGDIGGVHDRINIVLEKVSELRGRVDAV